MQSNVCFLFSVSVNDLNDWWCNYFNQSLQFSLRQWNSLRQTCVLPTGEGTSITNGPSARVLFGLFLPFPSWFPQTLFHNVCSLLPFTSVNSWPELAQCSKQWNGKNFPFRLFLRRVWLTPTAQFRRKRIGLSALLSLFPNAPRAPMF